MSDLMEVSFHFENNGSTILYYSPEDYKKDEVQA